MTMSESINGWTPPLIYEMAEGRHRVATQADIDRMEAQIRVLLELYDTVSRGIAVVKSRATEEGLRS
jgi:archaellum component FlaC